MPTQILFRRYRERADAAGGAIEQTHHMIRPELLDRLWRHGTGGLESLDPHLAPKPFPGGAGPPAPFETRMRGIHTSAAMKASAYAALRMLIARGVLLIPQDATDLRRELLLLRVHLAQGGSEKVEAAVGHDDMADALAFALGPYQRPGDNRWRSWAADLADPATGVPAPAQPVARVDHLPRVPVLQSIAGPELTTPPDWQPADTRAPSLTDQAIHASREARAKEQRHAAT